MSSVFPPLSQIVKSLNLPESLTSKMEDSCEPVESKEELFQLIQRVGIEGGKVEEAADMVADLEERINLIGHKLKFINEDQKPAVLVLTAVNPPVFERNEYLEEVLRIVGSKVYDAQITGGEKVFNPDVVLIVSDQMGSLFSDVAVLLSLEEWKNTNAVKKNRIYLIDGKEQFRGYSSRIADDIEVLAEIIYPQYLTFGGNGESWVQFEV